MHDSEVTDTFSLEVDFRDDFLKIALAEITLRNISHRSGLRSARGRDTRPSQQCVQVFGGSAALLAQQLALPAPLRSFRIDDFLATLLGCEYPGTLKKNHQGSLSNRQRAATRASGMSSRRQSPPKFAVHSLAYVVLVSEYGLQAF